MSHVATWGSMPIINCYITKLIERILKYNIISYHDLIINLVTIFMHQFFVNKILHFFDGLKRNETIMTSNNLHWIIFGFGYSTRL